MKTKLALIGFSLPLLLACGSISKPGPLDSPEETHLRNLRQLTSGGENAEAYFSFDGKEIVFQSTRGDYPCDQIYSMDLEGKNLRRISNGQGRTTCGYFYPDGKQIIYASTHLQSAQCPPKPDYSKGYVWALYDFDLCLSQVDGSRHEVISKAPGYDAEATISPDGKKVVFTSLRNGDLDLYTMNLDGSEVTQITKDIGYDGGAFFSPDSSQLVYRADHPTEIDSINEYQSLLKTNLVRPSRMEIFVVNADGSNRRQITNNGAANFAPYWHPDGKKIIFASNLHNPKGRDFDLYLINVDGSGLQRITQNPTFDGFPMFSKNGKKLLFASNRFGKAKGETNIFLADWVDSFTP